MGESSKIEWQDVPGHEGRYQVSSGGGVRRVAHAIVRRDGVTQTYNKRNMSPSCEKSNRYLGMERMTGITFKSKKSLASILEESE